jgi:DNA-directed RNA polymerase specialized sigma24 family protein
VNEAPNLTWDIRSEALTMALDQCWTAEALIELLADHRTRKIRYAARLRGVAEWKRIDDLVADAMGRCGVTPADLEPEGTPPP